MCVWGERERENYRAGTLAGAKISPVLLLHWDLEHQSTVTTFFCRDLYSYLKLWTHNMQMHGAKKYTFLAETEDVIMCAVNGNAYVYKISAHILTGRLSPLKPHINSPDRNRNFAYIPRMNRLLMCCVCIWRMEYKKKNLKQQQQQQWNGSPGYKRFLTLERDHKGTMSYGFLLSMIIMILVVIDTIYWVLGSVRASMLGAFQLRRERERWGGEGERRDGRIEREVCVYVVLKCFTTVASATVPRNVTIYNGENVSLSTS